MKKILFVIVSILVSCFTMTSNVCAVEQGAGGSGSGGYGSGVPGWYWIGDNSEGKSLRGVRITIYEYYNNISTAKKSIDFLPDNQFVKYLGAHNVNYYTQRTSRLEYSRNNYTSISYGKLSSDVVENNNLPMFSEPGESSLRDFFDPDGANFNKSIIETFTNMFTQFKTNGNAEYYYVIEPLTLVKLNGYDFYGTTYEQAKFIAQKGWVNTAQSNIPSHPYHLLPMAYYTSENTIKKPDLAGFKKFLASVGVYSGGYANDGIVAKCNNTSNKKLCVNNSEILSQTFGMGILWDGDISAKKETCEYNFNSNQCGNIGIVEPNSEACVVGKDLNYVSSYNDIGQIYCTNNVSTNFNEFYNSLNASSIRAGSYFLMKNLYITTNKTCYIKANDLNSVRNWEKSIYENLNGNINLKLGNLTYKLEEKIDSGNVVCESRSNGVCTKATLKTTHSYYLNYLTNRFISIDTMKQDSVTCPENNIDQCKTSTNIDNGGPRLTVPLNYLNGIYRYELDFGSSLLSSFINRLRNGTSKTIISGKTYELTYKTNKTISDSDLSFSCPYKVTQDLCEDDEGNLQPCPVDECENLSEGKCCINGKTTDCPVACSGECCDSNGNEIECPGGESVIGNVIYRPISLTNPFPGIEGDGRLPGSNWDKIITINGKTYSASDYYIRYNRGYNDYEIYQTDPLYTIRLDADTINYIRDYNDAVREDPSSNDYNDFDFTCENGEKCISNFLRGNSNIAGYDRNLLDPERSECYRSNSFDTCITRKGA